MKKLLLFSIACIALTSCERGYRCIDRTLRFEGMNLVKDSIHVFDIWGTKKEADSYTKSWRGEGTVNYDTGYSVCTPRIP